MMFLKRLIHLIIVINLFSHGRIENLFLHGGMDFQGGESRMDDPSLFVILFGFLKLFKEVFHLSMVLSQHLDSVWHGVLLDEIIRTNTLRAAHP